jgi:serine protease Do
VVGIETQSLSGQLAEYFGVKEGVLIVSVVRNSPAEKAGLKAGDVVTKVNGESVATTSEVQSQVRNGNGKRMIPFAVMRNHREMSFQVAVGDEPDSEKGERL